MSSLQRNQSMDLQSKLIARFLKHLKHPLQMGYQLFFTALNSRLVYGNIIIIILGMAQINIALPSENRHLKKL